MNRHLQVAVFLVLAFAITWSGEHRLLAGPGSFASNTWSSMGLRFLAMWGPAIAAGLTVLASGLNWRDLGLSATSAIRYPAVWIGVTFFVAAVWILSGIAGFASVHVPRSWTTAAGVVFSAGTTGLLLTYIQTLGEEIGWTGFLVPRIARPGKYAGTILYGVVWGVWHAPIVWSGFTYPARHICSLVFMCFSCVSFGFCLASLRWYGNSVFLTAFAHACLDSQERGLWPLLTRSANPYLAGSGGLMGIALFGLAGVAGMEYVRRRIQRGGTA